MRDEMKGPPGHTTEPKKSAPGSRRGQNLTHRGSAKHTFVVMHVDQRLSVSPPEPTNAEEALKLVRQTVRRGRCAKCVLHVFVDRTNGVWRVTSIPVAGADVC